MKPELPEPQKNSAQDQKSFEQLPQKTKELELLMDRAEKTIGPESVALNKIIGEKSREASKPAVPGGKTA